MPKNNQSCENVYVQVFSSNLINNGGQMGQNMTIENL